MSEAELERLALLLEELGEAQQVIGKIIRHGYESTHPQGGPTNRELLEEELGDVRYAMKLLCARGDLSMHSIKVAAIGKKKRVGEWLHHNDPEVKL